MDIAASVIPSLLYAGSREIMQALNDRVTVKMLRGYLRIRRHGPSETDQVNALKAAGVDTGQHGPVYADGLTTTGKHPRQRMEGEPLPERALAIRHLRK